MRHSTLLFLVLLLSGCSSLHGYASVAELKADAEAVFREHNRTAGDIMLALPGLDADSVATEALIEADTAMLRACDPLNELAIAHREGRRTSLAQRRRLPGTIGTCRAATARARQLLEQQ